VASDTPVEVTESGKASTSYVVARLERAIRHAIAERVRPYGLTVLQFTTLSVLSRGGQLSNAQLARRAYMRPQSMSEVIEALEANDLIRRAAHPNHRRVLTATLTDKGQEVLAACEKSVRQFEDGMMRDFDPEERERFMEQLKTCVRALNAGFPARDDAMA
jgi:DNA-binding MarR family transcriptional regulator